MKKFLFMFVALIAMTLAANATDFYDANYKGTVSNVVMGGASKADANGILFTVENAIITGDFDVPGTSPVHHIDMDGMFTTATTPFTIPVSGDVTVKGRKVAYSGTIYVTEYTATTLKFDFSCPTLQASFTFDGVAQ